MANAVPTRTPDRSGVASVTGLYQTNTGKVSTTNAPSVLPDPTEEILPTHRSSVFVLKYRIVAVADRVPRHNRGNVIAENRESRADNKNTETVTEASTSTNRAVPYPLGRSVESRGIWNELSVNS